MRTMAQRVKDVEGELVEIGRTPQTEAGYFVVVSSRVFPHGGARIRLALHTPAGFERHLDITTELARDLSPLILKAAELGRR